MVLASSLRPQALGVATCWVLEYGSIMRRLIDTECRQIFELQHTHRQCTARKLTKRTGEAGRERERGIGFLPRLRYHTAHPHAEGCKVYRQRQAQRRRRVRDCPPTRIRHSTPTHRGLQSAIATPSNAQRRRRAQWRREVPRSLQLRYDTAHPRVQQANRSGGGRGSGSDWSAAQYAHATKLERERLKKTEKHNS